MNIHHLNCGTLCPLTGSNLIKKVPFLRRHATLVCHCLLVELPDRLVMIDTGLGTKDVIRKNWSIADYSFGKLVKPLLELEETAFHQVINMGLSPKDVSDIILTHLDIDHAGGILDFPHATVHVLEDEYQAAVCSDEIKYKLRYARTQWKGFDNWQTYTPSEGENFFGLSAVRELKGLPPEILMIPLAGHTPGHCGVAIQQSEGNLLFAGDAYLNHKQLQSKTPAWVTAYNKMSQMDYELYLKNLDRLCSLYNQHGDKIQIFCSHDHNEFCSYFD